MRFQARPLAERQESNPPSPVASPADYRQVGLVPPPLDAHCVAERESLPRLEVSFPVGNVAKLAWDSGFHQLAGWIASWFDAQTYLHVGVPATIYSAPNEVIRLWVGNVDDVAEFYFNDQRIGGIGLDDSGQEFTCGYVKPGLNLVVIRSENSAGWDHQIDAYARRWSIGRWEAEYHAESGEGFFHSKHIISFQIWCGAR